MADELTFDIAGLPALNAQLAALEATLMAQAGHALRAEAEVMMTEAKRRTPVDTGALRASGHVTGPEASGTREVLVKLTFGGPAAPYAIYVHENMEANHPVGQAKFLESVVLESVADLPARVAARMNVGGG